MKVEIEFSMGNAAFEDQPGPELWYILRQAADKVLIQMDRPDSLCDAPEAADKLLDSNGNTIGTVRFTR